MYICTVLLEFPFRISADILSCIEKTSNMYPSTHHPATCGTLIKNRVVATNAFSIFASPDATSQRCQLWKLFLAFTFESAVLLSLQIQIKIKDNNILSPKTKIFQLPSTYFSLYCGNLFYYPIIENFQRCCVIFRLLKRRLVRNRLVKV